MISAFKLLWDVSQRMTDCESYALYLALAVLWSTDSYTPAKPFTPIGPPSRVKWYAENPPRKCYHIVFGGHPFEEHEDAIQISNSGGPNGTLHFVSLRNGDNVWVPTNIAKVYNNATYQPQPPGRILKW